MNKKQKKALKESIKHWERMLKPENWQGRESPLGVHCLCCMTFVFCEGCPIQQYTEKTDCYGTPYYDAEEAWAVKDKAIFNKHGKKMVKLMKKILKEDY
ncbi:MAG: hypothetical protein DRH08_15725 [Deltaproteobacteria bacterium]|nr:MAG: hypothetical protein DRH08_15725 [Deltaproteobacteria bacterium]